MTFSCPSITVSRYCMRGARDCQNGDAWFGKRNLSTKSSTLTHRTGKAAFFLTQSAHTEDQVGLSTRRAPLPGPRHGSERAGEALRCLCGLEMAHGHRDPAAAGRCEHTRGCRTSGDAGETAPGPQRLEETCSLYPVHHVSVSSSVSRADNKLLFRLLNITWDTHPYGLLWKLTERSRFACAFPPEQPPRPWASHQVELRSVFFP